MSLSLTDLYASIDEWRTLASQYLVKSQWFTLRSDRCENNEQMIIDPYYVIEAKDWVQMVILNDRYEVLLNCQYRHGAGIKSLELPCGEIETGEDPKDAFQRELAEETGVEVDKVIALGHFYPNPARQNNRVYTFLGTQARQVKAQQLDATEDIKFGFFSPLELENLIKEQQFPQGLHIASWHLAQKCAPPEIRKHLLG